MRLLAREAKSREDGEDEESGLDKAKRKMKDWVDQKKAEGAGGVSGAVVGGMLGGPLGAFVGAQVGSRVAPSLDKAMKTLDDATKEESSAPSADAPGSQRTPEAEASRPDARPVLEDAASAAASAEPSAPPSAPAPAAQPDAPRAASAGSSTVAAPSQQEDLASELSSLRQGAALKRQRLEAEVSDLYAKAEKALASGDEEGARAFLASRAVAMAKLEDLQEGQEKRRQDEHDRLSAEVQTLSADVKKLYTKAELAVGDGDEFIARKLLEEWQEAKAALESAEEALRRHDQGA